MRVMSAATTLVVAALFSSPLPAQVPDSAPASARRFLHLRPVMRHYAVDSTVVTERLAGLELAATGSKYRVRLSAAPLRFSDGATTISGTSPPQLIGDYQTGYLDTVRLVARGPSAPAALSSNQVSALGSVGTATLDLESAALGTPAALGVRVTAGGAAGSILMAWRLGLEVEPRPASRSTDSVYWRGTTLQAGGTLTAFSGEFRFTVGLDFTTSTGSRLNGRNLFPGGESIVLRADASGLIGANVTLVNVSGFYFRPLGQDQPVQANRLTPAGDFFGLSAGLLVPLGSLFLAPTASFIHESSRVPLPPLTSFRGSGWSVSGALGLDFPLVGPVSLSPEVGIIRGRVGGDLLFGSPAQLLLGSFDDPVSGWWTALELTATF